MRKIGRKNVIPNDSVFKWLVLIIIICKQINPYRVEHTATTDAVNDAATTDAVNDAATTDAVNDAATTRKIDIKLLGVLIYQISCIIKINSY